MALLADIYLANDDAHRLQYHTARGAFSDRLECQGITELQLFILWAVTPGGNWEAKSLRRFSNVFHTGGLPAALLADLRSLWPEAPSIAAEQWAEMRCKSAGARSISAGLTASARKAAQAWQNIYLGNSV